MKRLFLMLVALMSIATATSQTRTFSSEVKLNRLAQPTGDDDVLVINSENKVSSVPKSDLISEPTPQTLFIIDNELSISGGNTVTLPSAAPSSGGSISDIPWTVFNLDNIDSSGSSDRVRYKVYNGIAYVEVYGSIITGGSISFTNNAPSVIIPSNFLLKSNRLITSTNVVKDVQIRIQKVGISLFRIDPVNTSFDAGDRIEFSLSYPLN